MSMPIKCELRPGIGLCDQCMLPNWPQRYMGYGCMVCLDCLAKEKPVALEPGFNKASLKFVHTFEIKQ